jgi:hypothetical protein
LQSAGNPFCKKLWTCRKTRYRVNDAALNESRLHFEVYGTVRYCITNPNCVAIALLPLYVYDDHVRYYGILYTKGRIQCHCKHAEFHENC